MIKKKARNKNDENAAAVRTLIVGAIICEYGARQLIDNTTTNLKVKVKNVITAANLVQDWFLNHPNASKEHKETFKREFLGANIVLLAELFQTVYGLQESDLEIIINGIKNHIQNE